MQLHKYIAEPFFSHLSQGFNEPNPIYTQCGHHIGVDHPTNGNKVTPCFFPADGILTHRYELDPVMGNSFRYLITDDGTFNWADGKKHDIGLRFMHLRDAPPPVGVYKGGSTIGIVGTTGESTGVHLHVDAWKDGYIRIDLLHNGADVAEYLFDFHDFISKRV